MSHLFQDDDAEGHVGDEGSLTKFSFEVTQYPLHFMSASTHRSEYHVERHRDVEARRHVVDHADEEMGQHEVHPLPINEGLQNDFGMKPMVSQPT